MFQMFGAAVVNGSDEKIFLIKREFYLARNGLHTVWGQKLLVIKNNPVPNSGMVGCSSYRYLEEGDFEHWKARKKFQELC